MRQRRRRRCRERRERKTLPSLSSRVRVGQLGERATASVVSCGGAGGGGEKRAGEKRNETQDHTLTHTRKVAGKSAARVRKRVCCERASTYTPATCLPLCVGLLKPSARTRLLCKCKCCCSLLACSLRSGIGLSRSSHSLSLQSTRIARHQQARASTLDQQPSESKRMPTAAAAGNEEEEEEEEGQPLAAGTPGGQHSQQAG